MPRTHIHDVKLRHAGVFMMMIMMIIIIVSVNNIRKEFNSFSTKKTAVLGTSHTIIKMLQSGT